MTSNEIVKLKIITGLWLMVKYANDEEIAIADLATGIPDGDTPETNPEFIIEDFEHLLKLYGRLAHKALKDGIYFSDKIGKGELYHA